MLMLFTGGLNSKYFGSRYTAYASQQGLILFGVNSLVLANRSLLSSVTYF